MSFPTIIFAGTPEFAVVPLQALLNANYPISAVYTQPDRPAGRSQKLTSSPVKLLAQKYSIPVEQPLTLKDSEACSRLQQYAPDIMVVVAYGLILPTAVLRIPTYGCINIHASLLPRWRGAAPIQRAILAGDTATGITIMQMNEGLDTGPMLRQKACLILPQETAGDLQDRLAQIGASELLQTLAQIVNNTSDLTPQDDKLTTYAAKIDKAEAHIDWTQNAQEIERKIRAFNPKPIAFSQLGNYTLRIWQAEYNKQTHHFAAPGTILATHAAGIDVATGEDGCLRLLTIQLPGGKPLKVSDVLNARKNLFQPGERFS